MKKVLITGITGMDGSIMADYLLENSNNIVVGGIRRLSVSNHKNIEHLKDHPRFKLIDLDITDSENVTNAIKEEKPDYFINFAANSFVGSSWKMPINHMQTNCMAVLYQLEAIRQYAPNCKYYNAGSSEEFGDVQFAPQNETHPLRPRSPYGASKCSARHLVKVYRDSYGIYAVQGWLFNHEGKRRGEEFVTRKITKKVAEIKNGSNAPLELGNLDAKRDWSDAEDFVDGIWKMLNQPKKQLKDYVLASGETHTIREFVELAFEYVGFARKDCEWKGEGKNEIYIYNKLMILVKINPEFYRPAEVDILLGDPQKAEKELGWKRKTDFKGLVRKMVKNDLNNLD